MSGRAFERLTVEHLRHLGRLATEDRNSYLARRPQREYLRARVLCVALCQGGALHWIDGVNGVKDLDVYTFYAAGGGAPFPARRIGAASYPDSGLSGWSERVDILGRSIEKSADADPVDSLRRYLRGGSTDTARRLSQKAVVLIEPGTRIGEVVWPEAGRDVR